jgi:cold shock CspA family protein
MSTETATTETSIPNTTEPTVRHVGQVKWFNSKAGYGFITMKNESNEDVDIFTHYSTVKVVDSQYKYLVQGEYVEFELTESTNENHKYQATNVTGIQNGKLMCETRQQNRSQSRTDKVNADTDKGGFTKVVRGKQNKNANKSKNKN